MNMKFSEARLYHILLGPQLSEKTNRVAEKHRQFVFKVSKKATKPEIKAAVEKIFGVQVEAVNVSHSHAKKRRFKQIMGVRQSVKKAYVTLKEGFEINFIDEKE